MRWKNVATRYFIKFRINFPRVIIRFRIFWRHIAGSGLNLGVVSRFSVRMIPFFPRNWYNSCRELSSGTRKNPRFSLMKKISSVKLRSPNGSSLMEQIDGKLEMRRNGSGRFWLITNAGTGMFDHVFLDIGGVHCPETLQEWTTRVSTEGRCS